MTTRYLTYTLKLDAPVLITSPEGDPNSARTFPYISGAAIRGAVARALGRRPTKDPQLRRLVLDGGVRYLNAYPMVATRRSLPMPVSSRPEKHAGTEEIVDLHDLLAYEGRPRADHDVAGQWPSEQLGRPGDFATVGAPTLTRAEVSLSGHFHHQRDRQRGRAWTERLADGSEVPRGTVFAYEALDAGQRFAGVVAVDDDDLAKEVTQALGGQLLLGRSKRAGYGGAARIDWGEQLSDWEVPGSEPLRADVPVGGEFQVLLTSAYLGRHGQTGQPDPTWLREELGEQLGGLVEVVQVRWAFTEAGGYNRTWGTALPYRQALAAGSVALLRATQDVPADVLAGVEHAGLGERRIDGFGRCLFLPQPSRLRALQPARRAGPQPRPPDDGLPDTASALLDRIEDRIAGDRLSALIEEAAAETARAVLDEIPPASLLGRLRVPLRGEPEAALATLRIWLEAGEDDGGLRRPARRHLDRCRVPGGSLREWLTGVASGRNPLADQLEGVAYRAHVRSKARLRARLSAPPVEPGMRARLIDETLAALQLRIKAESDEHAHSEEDADG